MGIMLYMCSVYFANSYGSASVYRHFSSLPVTNRKGDIGIAFLEVVAVTTFIKLSALLVK